MSSTEPKKYYGAQTKTSIKSFNISLKNGKKDLFSNKSFKKLFIDPVPLTIIKALAILKKSFAIVNQQFGLEQGISNAIVQASTEIITEKFNDQFPLSAFQPGSGIITNMNVNEVIANRAMEIIDGFAGHIHVDPTRHVNMNQNENNTFAIGKQFFKYHFSYVFF
jgi:fumarate hydratase class II